MLFVIDDGIAGSIDDGSCALETCEALELLGLALFEGKHRATAAQQSLDKFTRYEALSRKARAAYREALNDYQADQTLLKYLGLHAFITPSATSVSLTHLGTKNRINIPPAWIDSTTKIQATCLVGEFLTDCEFLQRVGAITRATGEVGNCILKFDFENGGGSTCAPVVEQLASHMRLCCCVVDSDRISAGDQLGTTALAVQKFKDPSVYPLVGIIETLGRELENMAHYPFFVRRYGLDVNHVNGLRILRHVENAPDFDLKLHYDVKKGLVLDDVFKLGNNSPQRLFWEAKLADLSGLFGHSYLHLKCSAVGACGSGCECRVSSGFGNKVLQAFNVDFDQLGETGVAGEIKPPLLDEWKRIGRFLFEWGCARDRTRA